MSLEINQRITECRKKAKITKKELARRLGIKYTTYCRMEEKAKRITSDVVERIAEILGADKDYILYGERVREKVQYDFSPLEPKVLKLRSPNAGVPPFEMPEVPVISYSHGEFVCSSEEKALVLIYRSLSWEDKQAVREFIDGVRK